MAARTLPRWGAALALSALAAFAPPARAEISDGVVRIGVLTDLAGPYASLAGEGSVVATRMAVEDCLKAECAGMRIEVISADHQNRADTAVAIARRWIDQDKVDAFGDLVNASVQLAVQQLVRERNRVALYPGGTTRLTNEDCAPENSVQWMWDTYSQVAAAVVPTAKPQQRWFFVTADYAFGHALQSDATALVQRAGATVAGAVRHPFPGTTDFSSFLLQAQSSRADVLALANAGTDAVNSLKQAREFGLIGGARSRQQVLAFVLMLPDIRAIGLPAAQGTTLAEGFYWDIDEGTRAFSRRFEAAYGKGKPSMIHAGAYSSTLHYLRAVAAARSDEARTVVAKMHELPIRDEVVRNARLRPDGRMVHDYYLFRVKEPGASQGPDDLYEVLATVPGDRAFKPIEESACPALRSATR
ncbi:ABC transporter substrate-binding protein [Roseomonas sp. OT10]|uniref:ABC transporter substrate-binding protein n=1 Tax=Roseomonas cutis TaxID=2897332 RepID=UPI001E5827B7|nr:ABC transporter substrate-binding protein [Roseomonas sp. OT10]UFN49720.1 ABC transporter substrate-binding protein [Roseomonas sp. OT10]